VSSIKHAKQFDWRALPCCKRKPTARQAVPRQEESGHVQHLIATHGYIAVFVLMVAEPACLPVRR
jgi:hypothetical protein